MDIAKRWTTVGRTGRPGTPTVVEPPAADPVGCRLPAVPTVDPVPRSSS